MRWIFWFLLLSNLVLLIWRLVFGSSAQFAPGPSGSAPTPEAPTHIRLLSELDPQSLRPRVQPGETREIRDLCIMVGAFQDAAEAQLFISRLAALDVAAYVHPVDLPAGANYWVYLQPLNNRDTARRRLAELQARGIDSYIIPKGELENGISLGVFTRRDLAEARLAELAGLGLDAKMQIIDRTYRELWVMLGSGEEHKLAEAVWLDLLQQYFSLQQRQNFCSDVASAKNFH